MSDGFISGQLLIAMPGIIDPRFERELILVCAHDAEHAMGIAVNHPLDSVRVPDLLEKLRIQAKVQIADAPVMIGGPVERERGFVLHTDDYGSNASLHIGRGIVLTGTRDVLEAMAAADGAPRHALLALGYAGWGAGQLENELKQNVWLTCDADEDLIFGGDHTRKWARALGKLGIDPNKLGTAAGQA